MKKESKDILIDLLNLQIEKYNKLINEQNEIIKIAKNECTKKMLDENIKSLNGKIVSYKKIIEELHEIRNANILWNNNL